MPNPLVIVESPAKAKTIQGYLGDGYTVKASIGHVRDLPGSKDEVPDDKKETHGRLAGINPDDHFDVVYVVRGQRAREVVADLRRALKQADELILATDEDREGEAIGWHVHEVLQPKVPVKRMVFHEITPHAISEALASPRELDMKLVEAQETRRILDRLLGWETSPILWRIWGHGQTASAGRVQSVAVRLVVERERARMRFRSGTWHDLEGTFVGRDQPFRAALVELGGRRLAQGRDFDAATGQLAATADGQAPRLLAEAEAVALAVDLRDRPFRVAAVDRDPFTERPRAPFTTSTLQQESSRKLRFAASRTMAIAQRLYERGYITYMRTDSTNLSEQAVTAARAAIEERYGRDHLPAAPRVYRGKAKNAQEAHEAIRPAGDRIRGPEEVARTLDADERRLYELIWIRTVACQMADARGHRMTIRLATASGAGEEAVFRASGKSYEFLGFRRAYVEGVDEGTDADGDGDDARLPAVVVGDGVECTELAAVGHETKPPARFTDASLVKELEERGIGRPSTYAAVIDTIQRQYVWRRGNSLVPAWSAFAVTNLLERHFGHLVDFGFTATMEEALDVIARGESEREKWLDSFYFGNGTPGLRELVAPEQVAQIDAREVSAIPIGTDDAGEQVVVRVGRYGPYVQRGDDGGTASLPPDIAPDELTPARAVELIEQQAAGPRSVGDDPDTGLPIFVLTGRFGPYVQLGEQEQGTKKKPRRASLFATMSPETVTLAEALELLALPRVVGTDADGREIVASPGRYGPYLKRADGETRSLAAEEQLLTVTLSEAEALYAQPKQRRGRQAKPPIAELGEHPDTGAVVRVLDGRYGPYVTDGTVNATVPRGVAPATLPLDEAVALLRARAEQQPAKAKRAKKAAKKPTKKAAKKSAKKSAKKAAKKTAKKPEKKAASGEG